MKFAPARYIFLDAICGAQMGFWNLLLPPGSIVGGLVEGGGWGGVLIVGVGGE